MAGKETIPSDRERYAHLCDFAVKTLSDGVIMSHRYRLAQKSEVFNVMFQHPDCKENQENEILIKDFGHDTVEDFIKYLYDEKLDDSRYNAQLLAMAHKYQVKSLMVRCSVYLIDNITEENVAEVWLASKACDLPDLVHAVHVFLEGDGMFKQEVNGVADVVRRHPEYMFELMEHVQKKARAKTEECNRLEAELRESKHCQVYGVEVVVKYTHEDHYLRGQKGLVLHGTWHGNTLAECMVFFLEEELVAEISGEHLSLVPPQRGDHVTIVRGDDRNLTGKILSIKDREAVVRLHNMAGDVKTIRYKYLVKLRTDW